jgi:2-octaprenyl-6-methoxyphenol hydroxylase
MAESGGLLRCDIAIAGGGFVGLSLALALGELPLSVVVVEPLPPARQYPPDLDARTTALAPGSRRVLEAIGAWRGIAAEATPIHSIHVSDAGTGGFARLEAAEQGLEVLGYTIGNAALGRALRERAAELPRLQLHAAAATGVQSAPGGLRLATSTGLMVEARLVVAADGAGSVLRSALGIAARVREYGQQAIIANLETGRGHAHVAHERFTRAGPIAALPVAAGRVAIVWTLPEREACRVLALDEAAFLVELQRAFGFRLGRFVRAGRREAWPLALTESVVTAADRALLVGNAAQGLHPAAAQGFNLALRDVATLAEILADEIAAQGPAADPGAGHVLQRYVEWREADRRLAIRFTDTLVDLFGSERGLLRVARGAGLLAFDLAGPVKREFGRRLMGLAGRQPRLVRGLPLVADRPTA